MSKIAVVGLGYVGLSQAVLLSQNNEVIGVDISQNRVDMLNNRISPIKDEGIEKFLAEKELDLRATTDAESAYKDAEYVIIATPTNYDEKSGNLDTSSVEEVVKAVEACNKNAVIIVKSTVPIGCTSQLDSKYSNCVLFSPEFLREGQALYDNLHPSRIIVGVDINDNKKYAIAEDYLDVHRACVPDENVNTIIIGQKEAEAVKIFANTYLAARISYFNELDTYAESHGLCAEQIITGVCLDPRIGMYYNNPSFGYGGYCLPKDTKQLLANFGNLPQSLMKAIIDSNYTRKKYIADNIIKAVGDDIDNKVVGVYRLQMKSGSDNFRESSIIDIVYILQAHGVNVEIYEPMLKKDNDYNFGKIVDDFEQFKNDCDIIIANRYDNKLDEVKDKVYTRDVFGCL